MPDKDELDLLLDSALSTYADPGADSGPESSLAQRVLLSLAGARIAEEGRSPATKTRRWLSWAIAVPVAASLLLWLSVTKFNAPSARQQQASQAHPSPSSHDSQAPSKSRLPAPEVLKGHDFSRAVNAAHSRRALAPEERPFTARLQNPLPKLATFPSPQPLTAEEQTLVAVGAHGSDAQRTALLEAAKPPSDAPLAIADLSIPPLVPPDGGQK